MANIFEDFSKEFYQLLKNFIKKQVSQESDVEDILQEVMIKIYKNIDNLKDCRKIQGWVYQIARNTIIDYYRKQSKSIFLHDNLVFYSSPVESTFNKEIAQCLKNMIVHLPDPYRQAILLTEYHGFTQKEVSEKLGLSVSGVKSRVQRARKMLKNMLLNCCNLEFDRLGNIIDYQHRSSNCKYC
ncbi:RNA polymerase sigma factor SigZ [Carboxydothermus ferrireducens]|uniref:RNA polymerase sigma factor SigZ n=1 Tax=Carboxydothermus ferrireducens DSM 11255 TaxID=1119529 RepID=A0ABX2RB67_9THEO|nr:RNA polymerase sigma factor SigZ [Carboxydothermus ferrireducens]NYE58412.1 RNA polymerase sigma-70 factor (ECF subfamily) [Carboxydothermus ferrireducens DSM 11255]